MSCRSLFAVVVLAMLVACGPSLSSMGATGEVEKPSELLGGNAAAIRETRQSPLVVDWRNEERVDLEVAMSRALAVVRYDGSTIQLLHRCGIEGTYGFVRVTRKEQLIRLESAQELRANLPLAAKHLGIGAGAELERGASVEVGMVIVGKRSSVRDKARVSDLSGDCGGATHFVQGAMIGAFALRSGSSQRASAVAELFGASASAASRDSKQVRLSDGTPTACNDSGDASAPPKSCGALLRLDLVPLESARADAVTACAAGLRWNGEKCAASKGPYECVGGDAAECREQCQAGSGASCRRLARLVDRAQPRDARLAAELFQRACDLGDLSGCASAGARLLYGDGMAQSAQKAFELFKRGCDGGNGQSCMNLGVAYRDGTPVARDVAQAAELFRRSCDGGFAGGCSQLGMFVQTGRGGLPRDPARALRLFEQSCSGDYSDGCTNLGNAYEHGKGTVKDIARAMELYRKGCELGSAVGCINVGLAFGGGRGVAVDEAQAAAWYQRACGMFGGGKGCAHLAESHEKGAGVTKDEAKALSLLEKGCATQSGFACVALAERHAKGALGLRQDSLKALEVYERACSFGYGDGCMKAGFAYFYGEGVVVDRRRARQLFDSGCDAESGNSCFNAGVSAADDGDHARAAQLYRQACDLENGAACTNLGQLHEKGRAGPIDHEKASALYEQGCELGNAVGCSNLGRNYLDGRGVARDPSRGLGLLARACEGGFGKGCEYLAAEHARDPNAKVQLVAAYRKGCELKQANACASLGEIYRHGGQGVARDVARARETLESACTLGSRPACLGLAEMLATGDGGPKDEARAVALLTKSCKENKHGASCRVLSSHYREGKGVKRSEKRSNELLVEGCDAGDGPACEAAAAAHASGKLLPRGRAKELHHRACMLGVDASCARAGVR